MNRSKTSLVPMQVVHKHVRWNATGITHDIATISPYSMVFRLDDVQSYTELVAMYDMYRITAVKLRFQLITNPDSSTFINNITPQQSNWFPRIWYCPDYNDNFGTSVQELKQLQGTKCRVLKPDQDVVVTIKPAILGTVYQSALGSGYEALWGKYINGDNAGIPHYGLKVVYDSNGVAPAGGFAVRVLVQYFMDMKSAR